MHRHRHDMASIIITIITIAVFSRFNAACAYLNIGILAPAFI